MLMQLRKRRIWNLVVSLSVIAYVSVIRMGVNLPSNGLIQSVSMIVVLSSELLLDLAMNRHDVPKAKRAQYLALSAFAALTIFFV